MKRDFFLILTILLLSTKIHADQTSVCSQIADKTDRLECFDREFPKQNAVVPNVESKVIASPSAVESADKAPKSDTEMAAQMKSVPQKAW